MARRAWDDLSPDYRNRLLRAGARRGLEAEEVRRRHEDGDLRELRGHAPKNPYAAPREATDRSSRGEDTTADKAALDRWRRRTAPDWIPRDRAVLGDDTAAILSQIDLPPDRWRQVQVVRLPDGRFQMVVTPRGPGYDRVIFLPDEDSMRDVMRLIRDPEGKGRSNAEKRRLKKRWRTPGIVILTGTGKPRPAVPVNGPTITPKTPENPAASGLLPPPTTSSASPATGPPPGRRGSKAAAKKAAPKKATKKKAPAKKAAAKKSTPTKARARARGASTPDVVGLVEDVLNATPEQLDEILRILRGETR